jgi:hypothetical protein
MPLRYSPLSCCTNEAEFSASGKIRPPHATRGSSGQTGLATVGAAVRTTTAEIRIAIARRISLA